MGFVGLFALIVPMFGFLSYVGALLFPIVVLAEIGFGVAAVLEKGRWRRAYVLGNLGLIAGNIAILAIELGAFAANPKFQPNTDVWRPLYFGVVLLGLAGGITLATLIRMRPGRF